MTKAVFRWYKASSVQSDALGFSSLYCDKTFYKVFINDLKHATTEVIIESPFITTRRMDELLPILAKLIKRGVNVYINTRDPAEHEIDYETQAIKAVTDLQALGITVLYTTRHHRKLAIIDRTILWEGSLNILSQNSSAEVMRRIYSSLLSEQMLRFTGIYSRSW